MSKKFNEFNKWDLYIYIVNIMSSYDKEHNCKTPHKPSIAKRIAGHLYGKMSNDDLKLVKFVTQSSPLTKEEEKC